MADSTTMVNGMHHVKSKFIFVVGGVMSGIGKGVTVASTARIIKDYGFKVTAVKIDPYLNVDAGTMNPTEHGEVFVTDDADETDQDIGNYERFLNEDMPRENYMTAGRVYQSVLDRERALGYGGKCVQVIPHVTDEIKNRILQAAEKAKADFVLVEIGGTVGEYENQLFLETGRIMKLEMPGQVLFMLVSYFPVPPMIGEMKTKPTQHAVRLLNYAGIQADFIIARSSVSLDEVRKKKVSVFCNMDPRDVISAPDVNSIYEVPVNFEKDNLGRRILEKFAMQPRMQDGNQWRELVERIRAADEPVKIGIVGKYFETGDFVLADSYISVIEAVKHAAWSLGRRPEITWLNAEKYYSSEALEELRKFNGIIVPGGFGTRGIEGKINAIRFVRENNIPFLGLCYGLQLATIEFARNVIGLKDAHTTEVKSATRHPVIHTMTDQIEKIQQGNMGNSMRLGAYDCELNPGSLSFALYGGQNIISERHRHRYEVNNDYVNQLEARGMLIAGRNPEKNLVEIIELPSHKFFVGTQFHPELKSRPLEPHPLFRGFIEACLK